jgi:hypothetical protein
MTAKELFSLTRTKQDGRLGWGFGVILYVGIGCLFVGLYVSGVIKRTPKRETGIIIATPNSDRVRRGGTPVEKPLILRDSIDDVPVNSTQNSSLDDQYRQATLAANDARAKEKATNDLSDGWVPKVHPRDMVADDLQMDQGPNQGKGQWQGKITTDPMFRRSSSNGRNGANSPNENNAHSNGRVGANSSGDYGLNSQSGDFSGYYGPNNAARPEDAKFYYVDELLTLKDAPQSGATNRTGFATHHFLPRGYKIPIILLNKINTSVGALPVELAIAKDVEFNGKLQLPFGWKVMATAQGGANHKVNVRVNMILDPLGREYPISGMILNTDDEAGFDGYPLESPLLAQLMPIAETGIAAFLTAEKDVLTQQTLVGSAGTTLVANSQQYSLDAKNTLLTGASSVLTGIMERKADELAKLYPEGDLVPRGTLGYILVTSPLDLNLGVIGGSQQFLSKAEASPTPYSISIKDQQTYTGTPSRNSMGQLMNQIQGASQGVNNLVPPNPLQSTPVLPNTTANPNQKGLE